MEHNLRVEDEKDAQNLLFLEADTTPKISKSKAVYEFKEIPKLSSEIQT